MRRLVLIVDVDVDLPADAYDDDEALTEAEYPYTFGSFLLNEVNNCVEMPGQVVDYTARWTEYDTTDGDD